MGCGSVQKITGNLCASPGGTGSCQQLRHLRVSPEEKLTREEYVKRSKAMVEQIDEMHQEIEQLKIEMPTEDNATGNGVYYGNCSRSFAKYDPYFTV